MRKLILLCLILGTLSSCGAPSPDRGDTGTDPNANPDGKRSETTDERTISTGSVSVADLAAQVEEAAGDYYRAAGSQDWGYTYDNLDAETQTLFTGEEWSQKNQEFADNGKTIYNIESVDLDETSQESLAEVSVKLTGEDGSSSIRNTYFVLENGSWKHKFGQEEKDLFGAELAFEEGDDLSESGQSESLTDSSSQGQGETRPTANHMPYLDNRWPEGNNPMLDRSKGYEMYVLVDSDMKGTPVNIDVTDDSGDTRFNARTPYYVEVQPRNKYGNVGAGSVAAYNGNTDGATLRLYLYINDEIPQRPRSMEQAVDSCVGYECLAVVGYDGLD